MSSHCQEFCSKFSHKILKDETYSQVPSDIETTDNKAENAEEEDMNDNYLLSGLKMVCFITTSRHKSINRSLLFLTTSDVDTMIYIGRLFQTWLLKQSITVYHKVSSCGEP